MLQLQQQQCCTALRRRRVLVHALFGRQPDKQPEAVDQHEQQLKTQGLSPTAITSALWQASRAWDKYDADRNGSLSLQETLNLLNSQEVRSAVLALTNVEPSIWTEKDLKPLFDKADIDKSGGLSRSEFLGLYLQAVMRRVEHEPLVVAEALLGFIDTDRNGRIEGKELKVLLTLLGFPAALLLPIPAQLGVDYRGVLRSLEGRKR